MPYVSVTKGQQFVLKLIVQPRARKTQILGLHDSRIKLAVAAPPADGKANKEVIAYLAKFFGLRKNQVQIISGQHSRKKTCILEDIKEQVVRKMLDDVIYTS